MFKKATKQTVPLKLAITGVSGSGKTTGALRLTRGLVGPHGRIAFIDTENGSASLYSDKHDFDVLDLAPPFEDRKFTDAVNGAVKAGYDAVIIDSASHFWEGVLDFKSKLDARGGNSYTNWAQAGDKFKDVLHAVLQSPIHVICCLRSKSDYVIELNEKGKSAPRKVGLAPIMRDGIEYEFTAVLDLDMAHKAQASKDRTGLFADRISEITEATGEALNAWRMGEYVAPLPAPAAPTVLVTKAQLDKIRTYATALAKSDQDMAKAAQWASGKRAESLVDLTELEADKLIVLMQGKMNEAAETRSVPKAEAPLAPEPPPAAEAPGDDVPYDYPSDLDWLAPHGAKVVRYLVSIKFLREGQGIADLTPDQCAKIKTRRTNFEQALANFKN